MTRFVEGHEVQLLEGGDAYFAALEDAFDQARSEIHVQAYIFEDDQAGRRVAEALKRAARRGVQVHVLIDGFGGRTMPRSMREALRTAGVELLFFRPQVSLFEFQRSRLRRLHHKIAVVDGADGFVGGINLIDDMHTPRQKPPRWDYAVRVRGPITADILSLARWTWEGVARTYLHERWTDRWPDHATPEQLPTEVRPMAPMPGSISAALVIRDTFRHRRDIQEAYLEAIALARDEVLIANAYFLPGIEFRHALIAAAGRGVRVVLLLQARVEYVLFRHASRTMYHQLLASGVEIFEYHRSFMHAKVAVIDGEWSTVGSSNIDPMSLLLAREANVVVRDRAFAARLRTSLEDAMQGGARPVTAAGHQRGLLARAAGWVSYVLVRALLGWAGYGARSDYL